MRYRTDSRRFITACRGNPYTLVKSVVGYGRAKVARTRSILERAKQPSM